MANKRFLDFTTDATPSGSAYLLEADSVNGVRKTTIENAVAGTNVVTNMSNKVTNVFYNNAAAHNGIYRGKDLTAYFDSGDMSAAIVAGTYDDIYPGDYITKTIIIDGTTYNNVTFRVMHCYYKNWVAPHVLIMPDQNLGEVNSTHSTVGGYLGSNIWTEYIPKVVTGLVNLFGSTHIIAHQELLSNSMDRNVKSRAFLSWDGAASDWEFVDNVLANIPNEVMVYGASNVSSSFFDVGDFNSQLAAFAHKHTLINVGGQGNYYLRAIASATSFAESRSSGSVDKLMGNKSGIRPYFLLR